MFRLSGRHVMFGRPEKRRQQPRDPAILHLEAEDRLAGQENQCKRQNRDGKIMDGSDDQDKNTGRNQEVLFQGNEFLLSKL